MTAPVPSYYSVLQYVPHPLADERVNIGVVTTDGEMTELRLLSNWSRVAAFGGVDGESLRRAVAATAQVLETGQSAAQLEEFSRGWRHSVQLTPPRASLLDVPHLTVRMADMMLTDILPVTQRRPKLELLRIARSSIEVALRQQNVENVGRIEHRHAVSGRYTEHPVDLTVSNGKLLVAAQALSFDRHPGAAVQKDIGATAWVIEDIGQSASAPKLAVIVGAPSDQSRDDYVAAMILFERLEAEIVPSGQIEAWAGGVAERVAVSAAS